MKWLFVSLFIIHSLPCIITGNYKKVKILLPMPVQHVHHTKVVKVPEYHHYFHDRKQQANNQKRYPQQYNDFEAYGDKDVDFYDEPNYFQNPGYHDFEHFQEAQTFHDRQHTPVLPPQKVLHAIKTASNKRHFQHANAHAHTNVNLGNSNKSNKRRNPYQAQHYYHRA